MNIRLFGCFCAALFLASCAETNRDTDVGEHSESTRPRSSHEKHLATSRDSHADHGRSLGEHSNGKTSNIAHKSHGDHAVLASTHGVSDRGHGEHRSPSATVAPLHKAHGETAGNHGTTHDHSSALGQHNRPGNQVAHTDHTQHTGAKPRRDHGKQDHASSDHGHREHSTSPRQAAFDFVKTDEAAITKTIASAIDEELSNQDPTEIFTARILPIALAERSSSCTECHFSGVELRDFILKDQGKTFASLKAGGLINVEQPDKSKLLRFIARTPAKSDKLKDTVRQQELIAFRAWIHAAVKDPALLKATADVELGTKVPPEVIRHARKDRVLASFLDNIWSEMGRCISCHSPERNRNKIGRNGFTKEDVDAISWIVPRDPAATLQKLVDDGNIDLDDPSASQVLTKPAGLVEHKGGPKFFPGSPTYRNFLAFLTDYAAITNNKYQKKDDLPDAPQEVTIASKQQLRIVRIPEAFSGKALQVNLYRRNRESGTWSEHRWGTVFSRVNGKRHVWQNPVLLAAPVGSKLEAELRQLQLLPAGSYLAKIYIDRQDKTLKDPKYKLGTGDYVGEVEINGEWKPGYQPPKIVTFPRLRD